MGYWYAGPLVHGGVHFSGRRWPGSGDGYIWYDSARQPVVVGRTYSGHHYARPERSDVARGDFRSEIVFWDTNGNPVGQEYGPLAYEDAGPSWKRSAGVRAVAPPSAASASLRMAWNVRDGFEQWHNADAAHLEEEVDVSQRMVYDTGPLAEGVLSGDRSPRAFLEDAVGRTSRAERWTLKVDHSGPEVTLAGSLAAAEGSELDEEQYQLDVSAVDGVEGGSADQQRSGVRRLRILVKPEGQADFSEVLNAEQPSPRDSAPLSTSYSLHTDRYPDGQLAVRTEATDYARNVTTRDLNFENIQYEACMTWARDAEYCEARDRDSLNETSSDADLGEGDPESLPYPSPSPECLLAYGDLGLCTEPDGLNEPRSATSSGSTPLYGLADENVNALVNPAVDELQPRRVRKILPYDVVENYCLTDNCSRGRVYDEWKRYYREAARPDRSPAISIMVVFEKTAKYGTQVENANDKPTYRKYRARIDQFLKENPKVRRFGTWNEPNFKTRQITREGRPRDKSGQPRPGYVNGVGPKGAAKYANELIKACRLTASTAKRCDSVVVGEMAADPSNKWTSYFRKLLAALRNERGSLDGLEDYSVHPYGDVQRRQTKVTDALKREIARDENSVPSGSRPWLTEGGSSLNIIRRKRRNGKLLFDTTAKQLEEQQDQVRHYYDRVGRLGIEQLFYYNICEPLARNDPGREDLGFLEPSADGLSCGAKRPAWQVIKNRMNP